MIKELFQLNKKSIKKLVSNFSALEVSLSFREGFFPHCLFEEIYPFEAWKVMDNSGIK